MGRYPQVMKMKPETCEREGQPEGGPQGGRTQTPKSPGAPIPSGPTCQALLLSDSFLRALGSFPFRSARFTSYSRPHVPTSMVNSRRTGRPLLYSASPKAHAYSVCSVIIQHLSLPLPQISDTTPWLPTGFISSYIHAKGTQKALRKQ